MGCPKLSEDEMLFFFFVVFSGLSIVELLIVLLPFRRINDVIFYPDVGPKIGNADFVLLPPRLKTPYK